MARDTTGSLQALVQAFVVEQSVVRRNTLVEQIVFNWTGTTAVEESSRGEFIDAKKLAALEQFVGRGFTGIGGSNPLSAAVPFLGLAFSDLAEYTYANLMAQTHLASLYRVVTYSWNETSQRLVPDFAPVISTIEMEYGLNPDVAITLAVEFVRTAGALGFVLDDVDGLVSNFIELGSEYSSALGVFFDSLPGENMNGTASADIFVGGFGGDYMNGGEGNDSLTGRAGRDVLIG